MDEVEALAKSSPIDSELEDTAVEKKEAEPYLGLGGITYETTVVSTLTSTFTTTVTANGFETLRFTEDPANDQPGCLPLDFLTSNLIFPC